MMREFNVIIINATDLWSWFHAATIHDPTKTYWVHPESEHIFEPKHGDMNQDGDMFNSDINCSDPKGAWEEIGQNDSHKHDNRFDEIIMRDNKQFFAAEVEND